jgi:hypothetical protein
MLELEGGLPDDSRTLCVTALLLTSPEAAAKAIGSLEEFMLANRDAAGVYYGVLADLPESKTESAPADAEA